MAALIKLCVGEALRQSSHIYEQRNRRLVPKQARRRSRKLLRSALRIG